MKKVSRWILKMMGWDIDKNPPKNLDKAVLVVGPHTSNWDFIIGRLAFTNYGLRPKVLIKKELFFFPLGLIMKALGGIPVDRKKNNKFTDFAKEIFDREEKIHMVFTPEGTRSYNPNWKKGFYYVAMKCKVPIYICYMDYSTKKGGFLEPFEPTGDIEKDINYIKNTLSQFKGKYPENGIKPVGEE